MQVVDVISNTQQDNLEKLQQRAIRTITMNKPYLFNTNWPPLNLRRKMHTAIMTFKCLNDQVPYFLQNSITFKKARCVTRNSEFKCTIPKTKLVTGSNGFYFRSPQVYNNLPIFIREEKSFFKFNVYVAKYFNNY